MWTLHSTEKKKEKEKTTVNKVFAMFFFSTFFH